MPVGIFLGGPLDPEDPDEAVTKSEVIVSDLQTVPGWEIVCRSGEYLKITDKLNHVYQCTGEKDWRGRWKYKYIGGFTAKQFINRMEEG